MRFAADFGWGQLGLCPRPRDIWEEKKGGGGFASCKPSAIVMNFENLSFIVFSAENFHQNL